ncbi:MAG: transposase [Muribaculaceae bacterium]
MLRRRVRLKRGRNESPSVAIIDSQSVKVTKTSGECRGVDGGKKIKGRKRHIVTDTQGLLLAIKVHAANEHDSRSGWNVLKQLNGRHDRLAKIYADGGYRGKLIDTVKDTVKDTLNCEMEITLRTDK